MRRTSPGALVFLGFVVAVVAWTLESWLVSSGRPMVIPPPTLPITLVALAVLVLVLAWPIRRYTRALREAADRAAERAKLLGADAPEDASATEDRVKRVDPQQAVRVVALAKASSMTGAVISGGAVGMTVFVLTRPVIAADSTIASVVVLVAAGLLLAAGLLAESWCALPPEDGPRGLGRQQAAPTT